jgi:hypothetical protein
MAEKKRSGGRPGSGRKISGEGLRKPHAIRLTDAVGARIAQNAAAEGYRSTTAFVEAKTAY